jgi:hypothetical protein
MCRGSFYRPTWHKLPPPPGNRQDLPPRGHDKPLISIGFLADFALGKALA